MPPLDHTRSSTDAEIEAFLLEYPTKRGGFSASMEAIISPPASFEGGEKTADVTRDSPAASTAFLHPANASVSADLVGSHNAHTSAPTSKPKIKDHSTPEREIVEIGEAYSYMAQTGRRPNLAFTINLRPHCDYRVGTQEQSLLREAILQSLDYQFKAVTGRSMPAIHTYENTRGGHGIHAHFLAYCHPDEYPQMVRQLHSAFAKNYTAELDKLLLRHASQMTALGIAKPRKKASAPEKHDALLQFRTAIKAQARKKLPYGASDADSEQVVRAHLFLPFWVSSPHAPLDEASSIKELRYLSQSADPAITREYRGKLYTLEELSRDRSLLGRDGFKLEKQAPRFAHANVASARCVGPGARAADPTFDAPHDVISELLIPGLASDHLRESAKRSLAKFGLEDELKQLRAKAAQKAAHANCKAALGRVGESAESRHTTLLALQDMLQDRLGGEALQDAACDGARDEVQAAHGNTRRKAELRQAQVKIPSGEDDGACKIQHSGV